MKKFLTLVLVFLMMLVCLTACGSSSPATTSSSKESDYCVGDYLISILDSPDEYLTFLNNFNYEKYEVIDISYRHFRSGMSDWCVTWKSKHVDENTSNVEETTISVKEILQNSNNYIIVASDNTITFCPKEIVEFVLSSSSNIAILEIDTNKNISKATFCITQDMLESIK